MRLFLMSRKRRFHFSDTVRDADFQRGGPENPEK